MLPREEGFSRQSRNLQDGPYRSKEQPSVPGHEEGWNQAGDTVFRKTGLVYGEELGSLAGINERQIVKDRGRICCEIVSPRNVRNDTH